MITLKTLSIGALLAVVMNTAAAVAAVNVERVNLNSAGDEEIPGPQHDCDPVIFCIKGSDFDHISADGRYVVWASFGTNLVSNDTNGDGDVFLHDRDTGETVRVSLAPDGSELPLASGAPRVSADGSYILFSTDNNGVVPEDNNNSRDFFVHTRLTGENVRVTVDSSGQAVDPTIQFNLNYPTYFSADGRHAAFEVEESLVPEDTNQVDDGYVHDIDTGITELVTVATGGLQVTHDGAYVSSISADGRLIVFGSNGAFVPEDTNGNSDCFVRDRVTGETTRVSVTSTGAEASGVEAGVGGCGGASSDGRFIIFKSSATDLVPNDLNDERDIFIHDRTSGETEIVSIASDGTQVAQGFIQNGAVSDDGRFVTFQSYADTLVPDDLLGTSYYDLFLRDRETGETYQVSVTQDGWPADGHSGGGSISADGRYISFNSEATNIVPNDTNCSSDIFVVEVASIINAAPPVAIGDRPFALRDVFEIPVDSSLTVDVLANDVGLGDAPITVDIVCPPLLGTATVNADNTITYDVPLDNQGTGNVNMRYRITDADGEQFSADLRFSLQFPASPPPTTPPPPPPTNNVVASGGGGAFGPFLLLMSLSLLLLRYSRVRSNRYQLRRTQRH